LFVWFKLGNYTQVSEYFLCDDIRLRNRRISLDILILNKSTNYCSFPQNLKDTKNKSSKKVIGSNSFSVHTMILKARCVCPIFIYIESQHTFTTDLIFNTKRDNQCMEWGNTHPNPWVALCKLVHMYFLSSGNAERVWSHASTQKLYTLYNS